jgi:hypothetical protein
MKARGSKFFVITRMLASHLVIVRVIANQEHNHQERIERHFQPWRGAININPKGHFQMGVNPMIVYCDGKKYDTKKLKELIGKQGNQQHGTGVTLVGAYQVKDGRVLVVTDSVWESGRHDGTCVGVTAHFADDAEIASLAERYGGDITDLVPDGE